MHIREFWHRLTTTRHARTLEAELARERAANAEQGTEITRLRAENRALLNSILGIAGVPPLPATEADLADVHSSPSSGTGTPACAPSLGRNPPDLGSCTTSRPRANSTPHVAAPTRRRSWPQIHRLLEFESAQKEKPAADPLPPAHQ
jgi:hypothetical protein